MATSRKTGASHSNKSIAKSHLGRDRASLSGPKSSAPRTLKTVKTSARSTLSGPAMRRAGDGLAKDPLADKLDAADKLASSMPHNANKALEHGRGAMPPPAGQTIKPESPSAIGSTLTETQTSAKVGSGKVLLGSNPSRLPLDRVRVDSSEQRLTTNQGIPVADNQNTLKAGLRGPALLQDFIFREKITHFDHERVPERVVHARGSAAHGYFECYESLRKITAASLFAEAGKRTPVFVRFSTVIGERGSADTVRDVRGFAVKFYTDQGIWDLVGNNIPIFFIQDAIKFPDLVHAAKPEPHFAVPQASTAHDTFWDFVSLMPESTAMLMWLMSDRAIPRSYRMMQGFGVHTFRLVNDSGESKLVKFHWRPIAGTHSLDWDEAVKIAGADPDFHRRDLWEAIESSAYPEYELGLQVFTEEQANKFSFDVLDATKIVPEELVPVTPVGKMVLNRNPDNFFAETEQVAFCTAHIVPGLDFTNDPLLAGRIHSYVDTQISRLGGPNFHEIPINSPVVGVHNGQRDGMHRQAIHRGRVAYEPNSLAGGCPFQAGKAGFMTFPEPVAGDQLRAKPERFADHYSQATLFWKSQTPTEQAHIVRAFRFELSRVQVPAVRKRVVAMLVNVSQRLAASVADGLGMELPAPLPIVIEKPVRPEIESSPALSLFARQGDGRIRTRRVAILLADGVAGGSVKAVHEGLARQGAIPRFVGARMGSVQSEDHDTLEADATFESVPAVLYDALVVPSGRDAISTLANLGQAAEFVREHYRHCKPILVLGTGQELVENAGVPLRLPNGDPDPGILHVADDDVDEAVAPFIQAIAKHRHFDREMDPPPV